MITTIPVGSWSWETKSQPHDEHPAARGVAVALGAWKVLRDEGIAAGDASVDIFATEEGGGVTLFSVKRVSVPDQDSRAYAELLQLLRSEGGRAAHIGVTTIDLFAPGVCLRQGVPHRVEKLFMLSVDTWSNGAGTVTLRTFSDAWMSHSLRGYKQTEVQAENAPRLSRALAGISRLTEADISPGDATSFGIPTEVGFEDLPDDDPDLLDSWYMFEIPNRTERLRAQLSSDAPQFEAETDAPVEFLEVAIGEGVIGYVWGADREDAAGYEPRTPAGDVALDAAAVWLKKLSASKMGGLSPSQALENLTSWVGDSRAGSIVPGSSKTAASLEDLQELSGRE
ncbi:hypothetical protein ACFQ7F_02400 [Streptomyces sp. NPDC056486]|uniref:hypothetical protein n=1 Tax=Streptomyces sp. NPDC056486 TaxID=3345835 RepID=UPI0036ABF10C